MKTLYLLRHAHAEPRGPGLSDFDRPLNEQGRAEADAIGQYVQEKGLSFDFVMCSAALRCQETFEPLRRLIKTGDVEISVSFYNIPEDDILDHIRRVSYESDRVLYIGHNPGLAFAILKFANKIPDFLNEGIHPATLVGFRFDSDRWADLNWREGDIIDMYHPQVGSAEPPEPMTP